MPNEKETQKKDMSGSSVRSLVDQNLSNQSNESPYNKTNKKAYISYSLAMERLIYSSDIDA